MKRKFNIGDTVKVIEPFSIINIGLIGTILSFQDGTTVGVLFDNLKRNGHSLNGVIANSKYKNSGYYVPYECLEIVAHEWDE